jgi:NAD(P)-dependent dehydrogenase (short-subunit alcohol dehydrogenase family)
LQFGFRYSNIQRIQTEVDVFDLTGKVVVITGGNSGIGLGFARGIAKSGGDVVIWGRRADRNAEAADEIKALGARVLAQTVDVADEARVVSAMAEVDEEFGRVDGVIANAGIMSHEGSFVEMTNAAWHRVLGVNLDGAFYSVREGARYMKKQFDRGEPGGSLLFCASLSALTGSPGMQHYNASKGAMAAMSRGITVEAGRYGIRSNVVCPAYTENQSLVFDPNTPLGQHVQRYNPMGRMGKPDDFEGIGVYFMSDESRFHTGDLVVIDGGWYANAGKSAITELGQWP